MELSELEYVSQLKRTRRNKLAKGCLCFIGIAVAINLFFSFVLFPVRVRSTDMLGAFEPNTLVFVARSNFDSPLFFQRTRLKRGSVVYVNPSAREQSTVLDKFLFSTAHFFTFQQFRTDSDSVATESPSLRRLVGLPGDTIYMKNYTMYIKPRGESHFLTEYELSERTYQTVFISEVKHDASVGVRGNMDEVTLGENEYFLLADNRVSALDSRLYGPVSLERLGGKAVLRYFPLSAFKFL